MTISAPAAARYQIPVAQDHGLLGCAAVQHRNGAWAALDRGRRPQRDVLDQPVGPCGASSSLCRARWSSTSFRRGFPKKAASTCGRRKPSATFTDSSPGWTYWIYTVFYFPGLLLASASMGAYIVGGRGAELAQNRTFLLCVSLGLLLVAVVLNIIGLNIGKWLQNAGGVGTYVPLVILGSRGADCRASSTAPPRTSRCRT